MYTQKVMEAFQNPKNVGEISDYDGMGMIGSEACGDIMQVFIKVKDGVITDAKFKTFGCAAAIATSSTATEMIKGMTVEQALEVTNKKVVEVLGGLPPQKIHCSVLAEQAIKAAIENYYERIAHEMGAWARAAWRAEKLPRAFGKSEGQVCERESGKLRTASKSWKRYFAVRA